MHLYSSMWFKRKPLRYLTKMSRFFVILNCGIPIHVLERFLSIIFTALNICTKAISRYIPQFQFVIIIILLQRLTLRNHLSLPPLYVFCQCYKCIESPHNAEMGYRHGIRSYIVVSLRK
jgi:hypothetical protein